MPPIRTTCRAVGALPARAMGAARQAAAGMSEFARSLDAVQVHLDERVHAGCGLINSPAAAAAATRTHTHTARRAPHARARLRANAPAPARRRRQGAAAAAGAHARGRREAVRVAVEGVLCVCVLFLCVVLYLGFASVKNTPAHTTQHTTTSPPHTHPHPHKKNKAARVRADDGARRRRQPAPALAVRLAAVLGRLARPGADVRFFVCVSSSLLLLWCARHCWPLPWHTHPTTHPTPPPPNPTHTQNNTAARWRCCTPRSCPFTSRASA